MDWLSETYITHIKTDMGLENKLSKPRPNITIIIVSAIIRNTLMEYKI